MARMSALRRRGAFLLWRIAVVRCASYSLQPPTPNKHHEPRGAGALMLAVSGEEAQHSRMLLRAHLTALPVVGPSLIGGRLTGERPHSFGARPWCDVLAAASSYSQH